MKGPHICDCLCALCERMGTGAFGPQPDGRAGISVIQRRRGRRPHYALGSLVYPLRFRRGIRNHLRS